MDYKILEKYHVTKGNIISSFYFNFIYFLISNVCNYKNQKVLDYGGGLGYLKSKLIKKGAKVKIYDIVKELSDIDNFKKYKFDIIIFCQVLMYLKKKDVKKIFKYCNKQKDITIITCFSKQTIISKIFATILNHKNPHKDTKLKPKDEELLIKFFFNIKKTFNFYLFKIIVANVKN